MHMTWNLYLALYNRPHRLTLTLKKWIHTPHCSSYIYLIQIDVTTRISNISPHELFPFINSTHSILSSTSWQKQLYWSLREWSVITEPLYDLSNIYMEFVTAFFNGQMEKQKMAKPTCCYCHIRIKALYSCALKSWLSPEASKKLFLTSTGF